MVTQIKNPINFYCINMTRTKNNHIRSRQGICGLKKTLCQRYFPRRKPEETPKGKGLYLTICIQSQFLIFRINTFYDFFRFIFILSLRNIGRVDSQYTPSWEDNSAPYTPYGLYFTVYSLGKY